MKLKQGILALCIGQLIASGCAHQVSAPPGQTPSVTSEDSSMLFQVQVQPGQTLQKVGQQYAVPTPTLQRINRLGAKEELKAGQIIYIPVSEKALQSSDLRARSKLVHARDFDGEEGEEWGSTPKDGRRAALYSQAREMDWPLDNGKVLSHFGRRSGRPHKGIDIFPNGDKDIKSVRSGTVEFVGRKSKFGLTVIINHKSFKTLYAHCSKAFVKKGQAVARGELIAHVGATGNAEGEHLHFEYRTLADRSLDPMPHFKSRLAH